MTKCCTKKEHLLQNVRPLPSSRSHSPQIVSLELCGSLLVYGCLRARCVNHGTLGCHMNLVRAFQMRPKVEHLLSVMINQYLLYIPIVTLHYVDLAIVARDYTYGIPSKENNFKFLFHSWSWRSTRWCTI